MHIEGMPVAQAVSSTATPAIAPAGASPVLDTQTVVSSLSMVEAAAYTVVANQVGERRGADWWVQVVYSTCWL
jgi:hypothetical protein